MRLGRFHHRSDPRCLSGPIRSAVAFAVVLAVLMSLGTWTPVAAQTGSNSLDIAITFPDDGLAEGEQLCLALYPGDSPDLTAPPLQSRCLDPGDVSRTFAGIAPGTYQLITPSVGSIIDQNRYQVQSAETTIPADTADASFMASLPLTLSPEVAGTTGQVQLNVYGCPPGTDGQGDATLWQSKCTSPVAGVSVRLQGIGSIEDTSVPAVTAESQATAGRAQFTNLPPGEYQIVGVDDGQLTNVEANPAMVVQSNIEGGLGVTEADEGISLRPAEIKNIDIYLVLTEESAPVVISPVPASVAIGAPTGPFDSGNPNTGAVDLDRVQPHLLPEVGGGLSATEAANRAMDTPSPQPTPDS